MNMVAFELKKTWKNQRSFTWLAFGVLLVIALFIFNHYLSMQEEQTMKENVIQTHELLNQPHFNDATKDYLTSINHLIQSQETTFLVNAGKGTLDESELTLPTYPFYRTDLNTYLIKHKLPPYSLRYGTRNSIFTLILITYLASFAGITFFLFMFGDTLSSELERNQLNYYFSQPVNRSRMLLIKYGLLLMQSLVLLLSLLGLGYLLATLFSGSSSLNYPVVVFTSLSMKFIPLIQYIGQVFVLFCFVLAFVFALHLLVSLFTKKVYLSLFITLLILFEGNSVSTLKVSFLKEWAHLNPFTYLNVGKVFIGYDFRPFEQYGIENQEYYANYCLPRFLHNDQIDLLHGVIVLGIASIILLWLSRLALKRNTFRSLFS